ncbi:PLASMODESMATA CALLOSE-BINDING PROTEIN 3-like [Punica granatum]|uniref:PLASMODESMATA CALLOSE-BINDING PROTEIN 3-like n=1 Tax=Punica granatum TaxID=22663 RepID=A0A6P8E4F3_PUNGR|nr:PLASMODESMATA CALLOSE-BINDING PROTEIN 3-like [Punica granatum]
MAFWVCLVLLLALSGHSSATYCVCKDGVGEGALQKTIDYACGSGADCSAIIQNGACYQPNTVKAHCDYAANSYYQRKGSTGATCDFNGVATTVAAVPSSNQVSGCVYQSSPSTGGTSTTPGGTSTSTSTSTTNAPPPPLPPPAAPTQCLVAQDWPPQASMTLALRQVSYEASAWPSSSLLSQACWCCGDDDSDLKKVSTETRKTVGLGMLFHWLTMGTLEKVMEGTPPLVSYFLLFGWFCWKRKKGWEFDSFLLVA